MSGKRVRDEREPLFENMSAGDSLVVGGEFLLMLVEAACKVLVGGEELAQAHERAHDVEARLDGAAGVEDGGGHERAVLGEGEGRAAQAHPGARIGYHKL